MISVAREGYPIILGATAVVVGLFAVALRMRSWPMWLGALAATLATLLLAWSYR